MAAHRAWYARAGLMAAAIFLLAAAAMATSMSDIRIIMDPGIPAPMQGSFNILQSPGVDYEVNWVTCNQAAFPSAAGYDACIGMINDTGAPISTLAIGFTVPNTNPASPLVGQSLACSTDGVNLTSNTCPSIASMGAGDDIDATFTGGAPIPFNPPTLTAFFIGETGVPLADMANVPLTVTVAAAPTPEPAALLLVATGLLLVGLAFECRRRAHAA